MYSTAPSSTRSPATSDSDDEVNSIAARVYFGPVLSPEKRCAQEFLSVHQLLNTPARPSGFPSMPLRESDSAEEEEQSYPQIPGSSTWVTSPARSQLNEDEPSSVLASRILRAHDNPSPPPKSHRTTPSGIQMPSLLFSPVLDNQVPTQASDVLQSPMRSLDLENSISEVALEPVTILSPTPKPATICPVGDLISFDQSVIMNSPINEDGPLPANHVPTGTNDLLSPSPMASKLSDKPVPIDVPSIANHLMSIPDPSNSPSLRRSPRLSLMSSQRTELNRSMFASPSPSPGRGKKRKHRDESGDRMNSQQSSLAASPQWSNHLISSDNSYHANMPSSPQGSPRPRNRPKRLRTMLSEVSQDERGITELTVSQPPLPEVSPITSPLVQPNSPTPPTINIRPLSGVQRPPVLLHPTLQSPFPHASKSPLDNPNRTPARRIPISEIFGDSPVKRAKSPLIKDAKPIRSPSPPQRPPLKFRAQSLSPSKASQKPAEPPNVPIIVFDALHDQTNTQSFVVTTDMTLKITEALESTNGNDASHANGIEGGDKPSEVKKSAFPDAPVLNLPSHPVLPQSSPLLSGSLSTNRHTPKVISRIPRKGASTKATANLTKPSSRLPLPSTKAPNGGRNVSRIASPVKPGPRLLSASSATQPTGVVSVTSPIDSVSKFPFTFQPPTSNPEARSPQKVPSTAQRGPAFRLVVAGMYSGKTKTNNGTPSGSRTPQTALHSGTLLISPTKQTTSTAQPRLVRPRQVVKGMYRKTDSSIPTSVPIATTLDVQMDANTAPEATTLAQTTPTSTSEAPFSEPQSSSWESEIQPVRTTTPEPLPQDETMDTPTSTSQLFTTPQSTTSRRRALKKQLLSSPTLPFNVTALRNLTSTNTLRNQEVVSIIQTHIVKKEGKRPESPTVKLRTVLQKQKEEQDRERAERARRRRGGDDGSGVDTSMGDVTGINGDGDGTQSRSTKHRRGPGEDEDYESPEHHHGLKKRVKWDPDLGTAAFLDEIHVNPAARARRQARKSCFTGDTQRIALDQLGNLVHSDTPLNLVRENITVTRLVYDDDEEEVVVPVDPAPPVPRSTRSKSRKSK